MAHFAEIDSSNTVIQVIVIDDEHVQDGQSFCQSITGSSNTWIQTSYNTIQGEHILGGTPFRKNYASIGHTYNSELDAFIPPKIFPSWTLDENTGTWIPPVSHPGFLPMGTYNKSIRWNEKQLSWVVVDDPDVKSIPAGMTAYFDEWNCCWVLQNIDAAKEAMEPVDLISIGLSANVLAAMASSNGVVSLAEIINEKQLAFAKEILNKD